MKMTTITKHPKHCETMMIIVPSNKQLLKCKVTIRVLPTQSSTQRLVEPTKNLANTKLRCTASWRLISRADER